MIRCNLTSIIVSDQQRAEDFYVGTLGFVKHQDFPAGEYRWLTIQAADGSGAMLSLEPAGYEFARTYQKALYDHGIPLTSLGCDDVIAEYERLKGLGVVFQGTPTRQEGAPTMAIFDDTCGNLIMLHEG
ncbi:VOC family protein [Mesorhizobium sp. CAU 1741]|uniref:VOC family protein n=1 Tax=Mesorhizobium sp. CAU 1741 TaxID=3140366 RepID=UPI00325AD5F0